MTIQRLRDGKLTQTAVIRIAEVYGVRCVGRDGTDPTRTALGNEDINPGEFCCIKGDPTLSLHELVHGILGRPPERDPNDDQYRGEDESLLVEPLESALAWALGLGDRPTPRMIRQLVAAQLWRGGCLVTRRADDEDWTEAQAVRDRDHAAAWAKECRKGGKPVWQAPKLPAWF